MQPVVVRSYSYNGTGGQVKRKHNSSFSENKRFAQSSSSFNSHRNNHPTPVKMTVTRKIDVVGDKIGWIIGIRGQKIKELQEKSGAKIDIGNLHVFLAFAI
jgi:predicted PilT family ATPase